MSAIPTESVACDGSELELPVAVFHPFVFADIFSPPTLDALISSLSSVEQTQFMVFMCFKICTNFLLYAFLIEKNGLREYMQ